MMDMMDVGPFAAELALARRVAADAAARLAGAGTPDEVQEKGRGDLVTEIDESLERDIVASIRERYPDDVIVAEESSAGAVPRKRAWIIDPIDGTTNFVHGHPFACVSVAMADADGLAVGVVHAPFLGEVYHAARGTGAFLNDRPIAVSRVTEGARGLYATGFPFKEGKGDPDLYFDLVGNVVAQSHGVRRAGSAALDCAFVAAGRIDGYFEIGVSPWDIAAGLLLVTEAGGSVSGWPGDTEAPLQTGRVIASNGYVHGWMEAVIRRHPGL